MKTTIHFKVLLCLFLMLFTFSSQASIIALRWGNSGQSPTNTNNITYCGFPNQLNFGVQYSFNNSSWNSCNIGGFGSNPYRFTVTLFRDNQNLGTQQFQASACWFNITFSNILAAAGTYRAVVRFEKRSFPWVWNTLETRTSNLIVSAASNSTAGFQVVNNNGTVQMPSKFGPVPVYKLCLSQPLLVDGTPSNCENSYFIEIAEFDLLTWNNTNTLVSNWVCTNCTAPNNINIVQHLPNNYHLKPGIVYKFKLAVGPQWHSEEFYFIIECC